MQGSTGTQDDQEEALIQTCSMPILLSRSMVISEEPQVLLKCFCKVILRKLISCRHCRMLFQKGISGESVHEVDLSLNLDGQEGKLTSLKVISNAGYPLSIRYGIKHFTSPTKKGEVLEFDENLNKI